MKHGLEQIEQSPIERSVIAIDIGASKIAFGIVGFPKDDAPRVFRVGTVPTQASNGGNDIASRVARRAKALAEGVLRDASMGNLIGVGIGTTGCVSPQDGSITDANDMMPGWSGIPITKIVREATGHLTRTLGDVQAHALGEARWGAGKFVSSMLLVAPGTGLGGGLVIDGKLIRGAHGLAGHIGHTLCPGAEDITCSCGRSDHIEPLVSGTGIARAYIDQAGHSVEGDLDCARVSHLADIGDAKARLVMRESGRALGESIASWCNAFDPEIVVLSGSVSYSGTAWWLGLREGYAQHALPPIENTPIVKAQLGNDAALIGAACNVLEK